MKKKLLLMLMVSTMAFAFTSGQFDDSDNVLQLKENPIIVEDPIVEEDRVVERVAVLPFTGGEGREGDIIAQMFGTELTKLGHFQVVPRTAAIDKVMDEHNFQRGGLTDGDTIVELGKGVNAKYVVSGHIQSLGNKKMISASIVDVETFQQVAGGYYEYNDLSEVREYLPIIAKNIASRTERDYSGVPTLAILPFDSEDENNSDVLAQLLAIELANSGKYVVVSRTTTIENVMKEQNIQRSGLTESDTISKLGIAMNADYVLSGSAYNLGSTGIMQVQIINVLSLVQENGAFIEYTTIEDGAKLMPVLSYELTGVGENKAKAALLEQENIVTSGTTSEFTQTVVTPEIAKSPAMPESTQIVATPRISPSEGSFGGNQEVSFSCTTTDAKFYYTTNGIDPDPNNSRQLYTSPFTINEDATIKVIGVKTGYTNSAIATATLTKGLIETVLVEGGTFLRGGGFSIKVSSFYMGGIVNSGLVKTTSVS